MNPMFTNAAQKTAFKALQRVASLRAQLNDRATGAGHFWLRRARHADVRAQLQTAEQAAEVALSQLDGASRAWVTRMAASVPASEPQQAPTPPATRKTSPAVKRTAAPRKTTTGMKHGIK